MATKAESDAEIVVHSDHNLLLGAKIALCGLNRRMPEQELDLLEIASGLAAELGAAPAQIMDPESLDANLLSGLFDQTCPTR
jgi:hypothetical protein